MVNSAALPIILDSCTPPEVGPFPEEFLSQVDSALSVKDCRMPYCHENDRGFDRTDVHLELFAKEFKCKTDSNCPDPYALAQKFFLCLDREEPDSAFGPAPEYEHNPLVMEAKMGAYWDAILKRQGASPEYRALWKVIIRKRERIRVLEAALLSPFCIVVSYWDYACCAYILPDTTDFDV